MSAKHRSVQRPAPSAKPRLVVAPTENVLAALKVLTDLYESERSAREALERRVKALEAVEAGRWRGWARDAVVARGAEGATVPTDSEGAE